MDTDPLEHKTPADRLSAYLKANGIRQEDFAPRVGIGQASLSKIARGVIRPSLDTAAAIEIATEGAIPATAWAVLPVEHRGAA